MDDKLKEHLDKIRLKYILHKHSAVHTVEQSHNNVYTKNIPGLRCKTLFLTDGDNYYLVSLPGKERLNIKALEGFFAVKKLYFASSEEMMKEIKVAPGHVSVFCAFNNKNIIVIVDKEVYESQIVGFHPNINTETLEMDNKNFKIYFESLPNRKYVISVT